LLSKKNGLSEEEVAEMDVRFKHADLDRSGQLDRAELKALLKSTIAKQMNDNQLDLFINSQWHNIDKDNSGSVDFEEFLALYAFLKLEAKKAAEAKRKLLGPAAKAKAGGEGSSTTGGGAAGGAAKSAAAPAKAAEVKTKGGKPKKPRPLKQRKGKTPEQKKKKRTKERQKRAEKTKHNVKGQKQKKYMRHFVSDEIMWAVLRKHNSFIVKRERTIFSAEPGNLRNVHSFKYSGLARRRVVDVTAATTGGVNLAFKSAKIERGNRPKTMFYSQTLKRDFRPVAASIRRTVAKYKRPELRAAALARFTRVKLVQGGVTKKTQKTKRARTRGQKQ